MRRQRPRQNARERKQSKSSPRAEFLQLGDVMSIVTEELNIEGKGETTGRTMAGIVNSIETLEGGGFLVRRPFPKPAFSEFDPFLLLDEMGPMNVGPNQAKGAPDHPHRGFETVTYMLSGEMEHKDSHGHSGKLASGDV